MTAIFPFCLWSFRSLSFSFFYSVDLPLIRHKFLDLHFILEVSYTVAICRSTEHCWNFRMHVYVCVRSYQWIPGKHLPPSAFLGCDESGIQQWQPVIHSLHFSQMASHCPLTSQSRITHTHTSTSTHKFGTSKSKCIPWNNYQTFRHVQCYCEHWIAPKCQMKKKEWN